MNSKEWGGGGGAHGEGQQDGCDWMVSAGWNNLHKETANSHDAKSE